MCVHAHIYMCMLIVPQLIFNILGLLTDNATVSDRLSLYYPSLQHCMHASLWLGQSMAFSVFPDVFFLDEAHALKFKPCFDLLKVCFFL